jgi:uncharacterized RDD family membrane protein YckC
MFCQACGAPNNNDAQFCRACGSHVALLDAVSGVGVDVPANATAAPESPVAGFGSRFGAFLIDWLILTGGLIVVMVVLMVVTQHTPSESELDGMSRLLGLIAGWFYYAGMESSEHQATVGKRTLGLRVTDLKGERLTFGRASGRFVAKGLSAIPLGIGFLLAAFTRRGQALHDIIASTLVVPSR